MPVPTLRTVLLLAFGTALPLALGSGRAGLATLAAFDLAVLALVLLDARRVPPASAWRARREVRQPLSAFVADSVEVRLTAPDGRARSVEVADAPPPAFEATGHRRRLELPGGGEARFAYRVVPRARGRHRFGDVHLRVTGPLGLARRPLRLPLALEVSVYPDLRTAWLGGAAPAEAGPARARRGLEGREFFGLRPYAPGDDLRSVDWKATARRGSPVVRQWQPERNQTIWLLLDCGRLLSSRLPDGRTKLDRAVEAALAVAWAAAERGDRTGALLYAGEVRRIVPPDGGGRRLGPLTEALHLAESSPVGSDHAAALDALAARQRRRALLLHFTDLEDPDTCALLEARAGPLRRHHLLLLAAVADPEITAAARARPSSDREAFLRAAAGRRLEERSAAAARLSAAGVAVIDVPGDRLATAVVGHYLEAKARGRL